ncbi:MAG: 3D domain-containing protein [Candidatus Firestonebacteria bacterium]
MKKILILLGVLVLTLLTGSVYFNPFKGKVQIIADNSIIEAEVRNQTVCDVLKSKNVNLNSFDIVSPSLNTLIADGMNIKVIRVKEENIKVRDILPYETIKIKDSYLNKDEIIELESGENGFIEKEVKVLYHDHKEIWRKIFNISNHKKPKNCKIVVGLSSKKRMYMLTKKVKASKVIVMRATGYYPGPEDCGPYADGLTSIGYLAGYGVVAVDPKIIPLKSKLYINGYGLAIAADVGGAIKGNKIDLCFDTYKESSSFQPKNVKVYLLK